MTDRHPYTYVLLRYCHDPLSGEFANVGVVLHAPDSRFLRARVRTTLGRLSHIFPGLSGDALKGALRSIERSIKKLAENDGSGLLTSLDDAAGFAKRALPSEDSSFVWGPLGSGITADPKVTLDKLYSRFVGRYDDKSKNHRDDNAVWKPVRDLLMARQIADRLASITISSPLEQVEFDYAWKNGSWHCYQPVSFDLASGESIRDKANRWAGQLMALAEGGEPFRPHFVVGAPTDEKLMGDYEKAKAILRLGPSRPEVYEERDAVQLVDRLEVEIKAHDLAH